MTTQNKPPRLEGGTAATKDRLKKRRRQMGKPSSKFSYVETPLFAHFEQPDLTETSLSS